jgi:NAD(P)-dependent dehydrogenase (short-subunit alcohol dehydrogenase family)
MRLLSAAGNCFSWLVICALILPFAAIAQDSTVASAPDSKLVCVLGASGEARFADSPALVTVQGGIGTEAQGAALRAEIEQRFGRIDGVVTSVGSPEWNAPVAAASAQS